MQVYNGGRIRKTAEKSQYDLTASLLDTEKTKNDVSLQVAQLYLQILLNKEVKKITDESVNNAEKVLNRAKITTEVGTTAKTVEAEATASLAREKQRQKSAEIDIERSLFNLAMLLQLKEFKEFDVQEVPLPSMLAAPLNSTDNIINTAYENQPQVKAAETRILSAQKQIEIAKTLFSFS
jgi:outer membrane protein